MIDKKPGIYRVTGLIDGARFNNTKVSVEFVNPHDSHRAPCRILDFSTTLAPYGGFHDCSGRYPRGTGWNISWSMLVPDTTTSNIETTVDMALQEAVQYCKFRATTNAAIASIKATLDSKLKVDDILKNVYANTIDLDIPIEFDCDDDGYRDPAYDEDSGEVDRDYYSWDGECWRCDECGYIYGDGHDDGCDNDF